MDPVPRLGGWVRLAQYNTQKQDPVTPPYIEQNQRHLAESCRGTVVEPRFHDGLGPPAGGLGPSQSVQHPEADPVTPP